MIKRQVVFRYELLDKYGVHKKHLYNIISCNIEYLSLSRLKMSARIEMEDDPSIDFLNDMIQVYCIIDGVETPIGQFLLASPSQNISVVTNRNCECYSKLLLLDWDKLRNRLVLPIGTNVVNEVKRQISSNYAFDIPDSTKATSTTREWPIGTPKLDVINDLLNSINYDTLTVDPKGVFVSKEYVLPENRAIEITYDATAQNEDYKNKIFNSIYKDVILNFDAFEVPNIFIRYTNNTEITTQLKAEYVNDRVDSPLSTIKRVPIVNAEEITDVVDLATLQALTKRAAVEWTQKYENVEFSTAIYPYHGYLTTLYLKVYNINSKWIETAWSIDCKAGGEMKHTARRAVNI